MWTFQNVATSSIIIFYDLRHVSGDIYPTESGQETQTMN